MRAEFAAVDPARHYLKDSSSLCSADVRIRHPVKTATGIARVPVHAVMRRTLIALLFGSVSLFAQAVSIGAGGGPFRERLWRQKPTTLDTFVRMEVDSAS
ncbi:MAG: hypothetical protein DMG76_19520 [Acidobacteria bacterium]|nr:MAG: hypothetical protein DMG76_19520 [Acidobacteriota bacterium]